MNYKNLPLMLSKTNINNNNNNKFYSITSLFLHLNTLCVKGKENPWF